MHTRLDSILLLVDGWDLGFFVISRVKRVATRHQIHRDGQ